MTKKELLKALEQYPDDTEIRIWKWTESGLKFFLTNEILNNDPNIRPARFDLFDSDEVTYNMSELEK